MDADWWDIVNAIAQSVGAIGTTGALLVAALVYRRQAADQHRAQASRVRLRATPKSAAEWKLEMTNDSDQPVQAAALVQFVRVEAERSRRTAWLSREVTLTVEHRIDFGRTLWPGETVATVAKRLDEIPVLFFTDAAGHRWVRDVRGHLREIEHVSVLPTPPAD